MRKFSLQCLLKQLIRASHFGLRHLLFATALAAVVVYFVGRPIRDYQINLSVKKHVARLGGHVTEEPLATGLLVWFIPRAALRIVRVDLVNRHVAASDLEPLTQLAELQSLYLDYTDITDAGMVHLRSCPQLRTLDLDGTRISDSGLEHVGQIRGLKWLGLRNTEISDRGIRHLRSVTSLQSVLLWNTLVTETGVTDLRTALPRASISRVPLQEWKRWARLPRKY